MLYLLSSSIIDTGYSSFTKGRVAYPLEGNFVKHSETNFYEDNAGKAGIDLSQDSSSILYSNQGHLTYTYTLPYYPFSSYTEEERGGNAGITSSTRSYDICIRPSTRYLAKNPDYIQGAYIGAGQYFYSIRGGLPYLPNSYFVISNRDSILWISDSTYTLISKFPTKGRILRHLPDKYHSVTEDAVWSFADGKKIDSLPLLGISSFEPFPDGVHLLVMFRKSDSAGVFNIKTKTFVHYFRANAVVSSIAISHDGKQVALGDITGVLSMWGVPPLPVQRTIGFEAPRGRNGTKPIPIGDTVQFLIQVYL
ncbi:MAG: hypothetical protein JST20_12935 [Bacteroidetes bacterium]|nr:hypothetical protein [Bacteroidota bacterium]